MSDLEEIVEEMLDCISKIDHTFEYTDYFAERIEAARKDGTCKIEIHATDGFTTDHPSNWNLLSCGHWVGMNGFDNPRYCPSCGKRVVS